MRLTLCLEGNGEGRVLASIDMEEIIAHTNLKDTIREIHDNVAKEMYYKGIDDFANWLVEQGILGNRCISDGEITDYGKVYAKKYKEQLKVGMKNE